ncbi:MAG: BrnT family toxin [SAR324 cluster bacterium]|nr:BrnT family toxin [SAR324 cluster bacterium]
MAGIFRWDIEKNEKLIRDRGLSFEMIVKAIEDQKLLDIIDHPTRFDQHLLVVKIRDYAVLVPFVQTDEYIFFKTAYPSRKFTKKYLR